MNKTVLFAATLGVAFMLGGPVKSEAICLFDCGTEIKVTAKGAGRDLRENSDNVSGAKAEGFKNTSLQNLNLEGDGSVIAGNTLNSGNKVSVGFNGRDMHISSGNNIIGTMNDESTDNSRTFRSNNK